MSHYDKKELQTPKEFQSCKEWVASLPEDVVIKYKIAECEGGTDFWIRGEHYVSNVPTHTIWRVEDYEGWLVIWSDTYVITMYKEIEYVRIHIFK